MIFSQELVNTGRQSELDLSRAIACVLMVLCHVGSCCLDPTAHSGWYVFFDDYIGNEFAAPVFMALLGTGICYSRHNSPGELFRRGVSIFIIAILLNFFRNFVPAVILQALGQKVEGNAYIALYLSVEAIYVIDILSFAGLAFIAMAFFRRLQVSSIVIFLSSILMVALGGMSL